MDYRSTHTNEMQTRFIAKPIYILMCERFDGIPV